MTVPRKKNPQYERHKEYARARVARFSRVGRDIGRLPPVDDPHRKRQAGGDFRFYLETYFAATFYLPWSDDHLIAIAKAEQAVLFGGLFAFAMPRGTGKTSLCEGAALWAISYGHRPYVALIGSDKDAATERLKSIKTSLESNDLLLADFPEICHPIRELESIANRCKGQLYLGRSTHIGWRADELILPTIPDSQAAGNVVQVRGLEGRIRGMAYKRPDGVTVRPSLVILDDPQTDQSARSPAQCTKRERILAGAVLGLAGPGRKISGLMPCTVIQPGDVADRILDQALHPEWHGQRAKMLHGSPARPALWDQYAEILADCHRRGHTIKAATDFYRKNQEDLDRGLRASWPARFNTDEASAIQHAMNWKIQDAEAFAAEFQNEPIRPEETEDALTVEAVLAKQLALHRREIPTEATALTAFIDVQDKALYYVVRAWEPDFTGYVIDYGTWPDQRKRYYTLRQIRRTLQTVAPPGAKSRPAALYHGLEKLASEILGREWRRRDGVTLPVGCLLVDAGYQTQLVNRFIRARRDAVVMPAKGLPIRAAQKPFSEYTRHAGERYGDHWRIVAPRRELRQIQTDTNYWKARCHAAWATPFAEPGASSLWKSEYHRLFAEHLTAEFAVRTEARGRTVDEYHLRPGHVDNHFFDCDVGTFVGASLLGCQLPTDKSTAPPPRRQRPRVKYL